VCAFLVCNYRHRRERELSGVGIFVSSDNDWGRDCDMGSDSTA